MLRRLGIPLRPRLRDREPALLAAAFGGVMVLTALMAIWSSVTAARARADVRELAADAGRSMVLVGRVGRRVALLRVTALQVLAKPGVAGAGEEGTGEIARIEDEIKRLEGALELDIEELLPLLSPTMAAAWSELGPEISSLRRELVLALGLVSLGDIGEAQRGLAELEPAANRLQRRIAELAEQHERESEVLLLAADARLARMVTALALETGLLLLAMALVFAHVGRLLARRRRELALHVERIEQANRDLDAFAGRIAHDLRNVIAPVSTAGGLLSCDPDPEVVRDVARQLVRSSQRAGRMLDGLLAFSRSGAPQADGRADVQAVVKDVLADLSTLAERLQATVETELVDAEVPLSPDLLGLLVTNLVGNALKFLEGRPTRRVRLATRLEGSELRIEVEDTGPGIPPGELGRIFQPFYRAPGAKAQGTGIGLATVRRVVEAHGGEVQVRSKHGQGTRFELRLPFTAVEPPCANGEDVPAPLAGANRGTSPGS